MKTVGNLLQDLALGATKPASPASISNCRRGMNRALLELPTTVMAGTLMNSSFPQVTGVAWIPGTGTVQAADRVSRLCDR